MDFTMSPVTILDNHSLIIFFSFTFWYLGGWCGWNIRRSRSCTFCRTTGVYAAW